MVSRVGLMDRRIIFLQLSRVQQPDGGFQDTWIPQFTCWGSHNMTSGREEPMADQPMETINMKVRIRYRPGITSAWRLEIDGVMYDIQAVLTYGRREFLDLLTTEIPSP